ncbi:SPOR domain-containing protein [Rhodospirillum sp. A1_3_36]|uniref:SPOR domain-containing protein n=1 Tax=Rhodospirillum sp. A1_3_36 TaxID=3391666 RepID=UPI0039A47D15
MALKRQRPDGAEDDIDLDEQLMNLLPDELRNSDEIYLDDDVDGPRGRGGVLAIMFGIFFGLLVAGVAAWYLLGEAGSDRADGADGPPVITAEGEPYKTRPEEPGGMMVENKDKLVYNRIAEGDRAVKPEEKLLPEAEQPKPPPVAPTEEAAGKTETTAPAFATQAPEIPPSPIETDTPPAPPPPPVPLANGKGPLDRPNGTATMPLPVAPAEPVAPAPVPLEPKTTAAPKPAAPKPVAPKPVAPQPVSPQTAAAAPASSGKAVKGDTLIQVAALRTEGAAEEAWRNILTTHKNLLGSFRHSVVRADLGDKGIYFRLRVGPVGDRAQAKALCETLKSRGQGCIVVR